ncbi:Rtt106 domain containing protein [Hyaloscypha variabilis]
MGSALDTKSLDKAFEGRLDLQTAIRNAAAAGPHYIELFNQISLHVCSLVPTSNSQPSSKKRRLDEELTSRPASNGTNGLTKSTPLTTRVSAASGNDPVLLEIKDISVVIPQRKKYTLCFTASHLYARLPDSKEPVAGISYAWSDIDYTFFLPVPEKTQKQYNYVLFPKNSIITPTRPAAGTPPTPEPIVFTIPDSAPKPGTISGLEAAAAAAVSDDFKTLLDWQITARLKAAGKSNLKIVEADAKLFASEQKQAHRPGEKAVFVKAFRGSKDGYLFFLPTGILWGFKKPMMFLPHERIAAVSYTSVLQRTFNLSIEVDMSIAGGDEVKEEFEFSMLDQEDFGGIDGFVKRHGLQDKSMAEQRKAKRLNVNVVKDEDGNVIGNAEAGELEKAAIEAEQEAVDLEDEDEEDYDPGSEGESEGSGSDSEEEDSDGEGGGEAEDDEDGDGEEDEL